MIHIGTAFILGSATALSGLLVYALRTVIPREVDHRYRNSIRAFSSAIELRFPEHAGTTKRVAELARLIAKELRMSRDEVQDLEQASYLRDIGLSAVPYRLLNEKPFREWTPAEQELYDRHPAIGAEMLDRLASFRKLAPIVRDHHRPFHDGGRKIPLGARILCVVTDYVWNERAIGHGLALQSMVDQAGDRYDPDVVAVLKKVYLLESRHDERTPVQVS